MNTQKRNTFELSNPFCHANDLDESYEYLENNIPRIMGLILQKTF